MRSPKTVLLMVAEVALQAELLRQHRNDPVILLEVRPVQHEDLPMPPTLPKWCYNKGKSVGPQGKTHERKRIEREQRKRHGQRMKGR